MHDTRKWNLIVIVRPVRRLQKVYIVHYKKNTSRILHGNIDVSRTKELHVLIQMTNNRNWRTNLKHFKIVQKCRIKSELWTTWSLGPMVIMNCRIWKRNIQTLVPYSLLLVLSKSFNIRISEHKLTVHVNLITYFGVQRCINQL